MTDDVELSPVLSNEQVEEAIRLYLSSKPKREAPVEELDILVAWIERAQISCSLLHLFFNGEIRIAYFEDEEPQFYLWKGESEDNE